MKGWCFPLAAKPEYITKKVTHQKTLYKLDSEGKRVKDKVVRTDEDVTYRIDAAFVPSDISEICLEFIENYCEANNQIDWLVDTVSKTITDKNGKKRDLPFVNLRAEFAKTFFSNIIKGEKGGAPTMKARILAKYRKK
jgi:S-adenosylmethionine synthetase